MIFIIDEKPHPRFKRDGNDLVLQQRISLADALCGVELNIQTLDNRTLQIPLRDTVITPGMQKVVR
jgi:DnaJ family protein B protein 4